MSDHAPIVVYDDAVAVPPEVTSLTGVTRFGDVLRRRERLSATVRALAEESGLEGPLHLRDASDRAMAEERLRRQPPGTLVLLLPSHLAPSADHADAVLFLRKLRYMTRPIALRRDGGPVGACLADRDAAADYLAEAGVGNAEAARWLRDYVEGLPPVDDVLGLADLTRLPVALEFLSASFSARSCSACKAPSRKISSARAISPISVLSAVFGTAAFRSPAAMVVIDRVRPATGRSTLRLIISAPITAPVSAAPIRAIAIRLAVP